MNLKNFIGKIFFISLILIFTAKAFSLSYYISSSGNDNNNGTSTSTPWQSITKVNAMMNSFNPGDQILFNKGDTFFGTIFVTRSGTAGNLITFGSYGSGNMPVITGKKIISGWTVYSGNIYKATTTDSISHVYINQQIMMLARYPNTGFLKIDAGNGINGFYDAALTQSTGYWNGANARVRTINWSYETRVVSNFSAGNILFSIPTVNPNSANYGYYLDNKLSMLDVQNEWFLDKPGNTLYLYAPGGVNPNTLAVEALVSRFGINVDIHVNYIMIRDININGYRENGIDAYSSDNTTIQNCFINHTVRYAIRVNGTGNKILDNTFEDNLNSAVNGIFSNGFITGNSIKRTGLVAGYGENSWGYMAIMLFTSSGTNIDNNIIDSSGYDGIAISNGSLTIKNNIISNSVLTMNDGGGIATGTSDGLSIIDNIIFNSIGNTQSSGNPSLYGNGIYINDAVLTNCTVKGNTLYNNRNVGIQMDLKAGSSNVNILGNTLYNNFYGQIFFTDLSNPGFVPSYNTVIRNNIFYSLQSQQSCMDQIMFHNSIFTDYGNFDSNYYCNPYSDYVIRRIHLIPSYNIVNYKLANWKSSFNEDLNSKESQFSFEQYGVTDTLSGNLITNSKFISNTSNWSTWPSGSSISYAVNPLLDSGCMKLKWNGSGYSESFTMCNTYPMTKGYYYLFSLSSLGNQEGTFNTWGRSSTSGNLETFPKQIFSYENFRSEHSFVIKADTTDALAKMSIGLTLPDSVLFVDNVNAFRVNVERIDSTEKSKLFTNINSFPITIFLDDIPYKNIDGVPVAGNLTLQPFSSKILIYDDPSPIKILHLKVIPEGFYNSATDRMMSDSVKIYLRNSNSPYNILDSSRSLLDSSGNGSFNFLNAANSLDYFISVNHRNSVDTWSKLPLSFAANNLIYDFTTSSNTAYGNNLVLKGVRYCIYSGDVNKDNEMTLHDIIQTYNSASNFSNGYAREDVNGDGTVNLLDIGLVFNNANIFVKAIKP